MRHPFAIPLVTVLALGLAGCGGSAAPAVTVTATQTATASSYGDEGMAPVALGGASFSPSSPTGLARGRAAAAGMRAAYSPSFHAFSRQTAHVDFPEPTDEYEGLRRSLSSPTEVWSRADVLARPCPVPAVAGIYAWFFDAIPSAVALEGTHRWEGRARLYVGISPGRPPQPDGTTSRQTLRHRIRYHYRGNAEGSTLRLTLGCLLSEELGIQLRRVGSGKRLTFAGGERLLSEWMDQHAYVAWAPHPAPWEPEKVLIADWVLPLNLDHNQRSPFAKPLSAYRAAARATARALPIVTKDWTPERQS